MKKIYLLIFLTTAINCGLNAQTLTWAKQLGGTADEFGYSITVDASGNVYTTGAFQGTVDFNPGAATFNLTAFGGYDIFVSKLDAAGNFVWAKQLGGTSDELGHSIAVDASGNVYTTGEFQGTVDFDPGAASFNFTSAGLDDIFISKLDAAGNFVWAVRFGGTASEAGLDIALDASGNVYTTGAFRATIDFDPGAGTFNLTTAGLDDIFISKLDAAGNFVWAKQLGGTTNDNAFSITVDASGNVYTTGFFTGTADFNPGAATVNLISAGLRDIFVSKLDAAGNFVYAKQLGGTGTESGNSITLDAAGNVYTAGDFSSTADFDPGAGTVNLTSAGNADIFVSKLDATGNFVWAKGMGGTGIDIASAIAVDAAGNVYTNGGFEFTVDFDPGAATFNLTSLGNEEVFVSKLDAAGNFVWAVRLGGTDGEVATSIALDATGNVYSTGGFEGTCDFDPSAGTSNLTALGVTDVFVHKMSQAIADPPPTVTINQAAAQPDPTGTSPINFTVVFNETVTGFATGDVTISGTAGATTATVTGSGTTYNVAVSGMTANGTVIATIAAGVAIDAGGNPNLASTSTDNTVTYTGIVDPPPTVTINQAAAQPDPTGTSPINFTVVFNETVTGFATGDVTLSGTAGATTATVTGSGTTYNVAVSGMTANGTVIATIAAGVATDAGGNPNLASTSTDNTVTYTGIVDPPPTVTINQAAAQADPTAASPINFTVVFNETVTGFTTGDVTISGTAGATTATVTGSGTTYNVAVSGMTGSGTVIATIPAGVAIDAGSNPNLASTSIDNTVQFNLPPCTLTCPANITVSNTAGQCGAVVNYPAPTTTGSCGTVTSSPASGSFFPVGTTTVTVTSSAGPGCTFTITVNDVQPPTITCPANIVINSTLAGCAAVVNYPSPTVSDNCPGTGAPTLLSGLASGSNFPTGATTVSYRVTDAAGNTATCSFTVTVVAPDVNQPANQNHCAGLTVPATTFSSNVAGATFSWSRTNEAIGLAATSGAGNVPSFTAANISAPLTSTFTVIANNGACVSTPKQFTIRINILSSVTLTLPFDTLYQNSPVQILSGGSPAGGVFSGTGVSGTQINPGAFQQGNYIVSYRYTDPSGCTGTATDVFTIIAKANRVNIFPVPSDGNLSIAVSPEMVGAAVKAYNAGGQKIAEWVVGGKLTSYRLNWAAGVYSLEFTKGTLKELKTIVIVR
jgi:hypothetical protein